MSGVVAAHDLILFGGFIAVGIWLEGVGKKTDWFDELFAPAPLAFLGAVIIAAENVASWLGGK